MVKFPPGGLFSGLPRLGSSQLFALCHLGQGRSHFLVTVKSAALVLIAEWFIPRGESGLGLFQILRSSFPFLLALATTRSMRVPLGFKEVSGFP